MITHIIDAGGSARIEGMLNFKVPFQVGWILGVLLSPIVAGWREAWVDSLQSCQSGALREAIQECRVVTSSGRKDVTRRTWG